jgi:TM2 domain-containing membrane protein YozV
MLESPSNKMSDKHKSHLILLGCSVVNVVPMTVLLGMTLGGITTPWMVPVLGALAVVMAVLPWVAGIGSAILFYLDKPGLLLCQPPHATGKYQNKRMQSKLSLAKFLTLIIAGIPSLALGIAAAVLLLRDGPTHVALLLTITLTVLAVAMHLVLHVCAAKEEDLKFPGAYVVQ